MLWNMISQIGYVTFFFLQNDVIGISTVQWFLFSATYNIHVALKIIIWELH